MLYAIKNCLNLNKKPIGLSNGFSLLELLLVVALIGILAAFAVPTYQTYLQKTRFMEVVQLSQAIRVAQSACLLQVGRISVLVIPSQSLPCPCHKLAIILKVLIYQQLMV